MDRSIVRKRLLFLSAFLCLTVACGNTDAPLPAQPSEYQLLEEAETSASDAIILSGAIPGYVDFVRMEVIMQVSSHENGNIIEIPQLTWNRTEDEPRLVRQYNIGIR